MVVLLSMDLFGLDFMSGIGQFKQETSPIVVRKGLSSLDGLWSPSLLRKEAEVLELMLLETKEFSVKCHDFMESKTFAYVRQMI